MAAIQLQYSPLLVYREGQGLVVFCQMDVTGRTDSDPAADLLVRNLLTYVSDWKPTTRRTVVYAGDPSGSEISNPPVSRWPHIR